MWNELCSRFQFHLVTMVSSSLPFNKKWIHCPGTVAPLTPYSLQAPGQSTLETINQLMSLLTRKLLHTRQPCKAGELAHAYHPLYYSRTKALQITQLNASTKLVGKTFVTFILLRFSLNKHTFTLSASQVFNNGSTLLHRHLFDSKFFFEEVNYMTASSWTLNRVRKHFLQGLRIFRFWC